MNTTLSESNRNATENNATTNAFVMVPMSLIQQPPDDGHHGPPKPGRLTADQLALYVALRSRIDNGKAEPRGEVFSGHGVGECYPGRAWLARAMGLSENSRKSVDRALTALVDMGIVQRLHRWIDDQHREQPWTQTARQGRSLYRVSLDGGSLPTDDIWGRAVSAQVRGGVSEHQGVVSDDTGSGVSEHQGVVSDSHTIYIHSYQDPLELDPKDQGKRDSFDRGRTRSDDPAVPIGRTWHANGSHVEAGSRIGFHVVGLARVFKRWAKESGSRRADWDATFGQLIRLIGDDSLALQFNDHGFDIATVLGLPDDWWEAHRLPDATTEPADVEPDDATAIAAPLAECHHDGRKSAADGLDTRATVLTPYSGTHNATPVKTTTPESFWDELPPPASFAMRTADPCPF